MATKQQEISALKKKNEKLLKMLGEEREKVAGYEQVAKVHCAYISILLKRLGATKDKAVEIQPQEIADNIGKDEARALISGSGVYSLYIEE